MSSVRYMIYECIGTPEIGVSEFKCLVVEREYLDEYVDRRRKEGAEFLEMSVGGLVILPLN